MLRKLTVRNYALINELDAEFDNGLTIITGETGAGKSILLGALSLILGNRADSGVLLNRDEKCVVEGHFDVKGYDLKPFFTDNSLDYEDTAILRREINPAGKSRAFINDTPVTVNVLKDLGDRLIDIHSQHQTLMLNDNSFQLSVIDSFADVSSDTDNYKAHFSKFRLLKNEFQTLSESTEKSKSDLEYYRFQLRQLEEAKLKKDEQTELEHEQEILNHAEEIHEALFSASTLLSGESSSVLSMLRDARNSISKIREYLDTLPELLSRTESSLIELDDIASEVEKIMGTIEADPDRLISVNNRLDTIYSLIQKHHVADANALLLKKDEIAAIVNSIETGDEKLAELEKQMKQERTTLEKIAGTVSDKRGRSIPGIEEKITQILRLLGIPNARFRIMLTHLNDFTSSGTDHADFLFSANKQIEPENLAKIASGGELSRVMLSLKSVMAKNKNLPTIIFDEIDSGVSGEVADKVGQILTEMGKYMQVINITHLPQVASRGNRHYHVYKADTDDSTFTRLKLLSKEERILEVARLLSGSEITDTAIKNARELLSAARN